MPMTRFADQTFWGADIPFAIMPKFIKDHEMFYWWHTREDTFDKVDPEVALRDTKGHWGAGGILRELREAPRQT